MRVSGGLAVAGRMVFDEADLASMEANGTLGPVIIHEMGHVLGFGGSPPWTDLLVGKGTDDPYWPGVTAVAEYDAAGGSALNRVPVENIGGEGTRDAHWRDSSLGTELMTGFITSGSPAPLSAITVGAMQDIGYQVDLSKADTYTVSAALRILGPVIQLRELMSPPPLFITPQGRIVGSIRLR